ncbi:hypothetical protein [Streptomyces sp. NPDC010273]|uniref:hypothetical protein n=1 Tax=Streptomyces sp. NPDC010273 TaxID=3364829 RepID=UPI0036EF2734
MSGHPLPDQLCRTARAEASIRCWSKADKDSSEWLPPYAGYRCQYDTDWIADKTRWGLSIDPVERGALTQQLADCLDQRPP